MSRPATGRALLLLVLTALLTVVPLQSASAAPVTLSGVVSTNLGTVSSGEVSVVDSEGSTVVRRNISSGGGYTLQVEPGTYTFELFGEVGPQSYFQFSERDVEVTAGGTLDFSAPELPLTVHLEDSTGQPIAAPVQLYCQQLDENGSFDRFMDSWAPSASTSTVWGFPVVADVGDSDERRSECHLLAHLPGQAAVLRQVELVPEADNEVTVTIQDAVTVSGTLRTGRGPASGSVTVYDSRAHTELLSVDVPTSGAYEVRLEPGSYRFDFDGGTWAEDGTAYESLSWRTSLVDVTGPTTYDADLGDVPVTVHLVGPDGAPATSTVQLGCAKNPDPWHWWEYADLRSIATGTGQVTLYGVPADAEWYCYLYDEATNGFGDVVIHPSDNEVTFLTETGTVIQGDPEASVDGDGVPDVTEALGPNDGDGNGDGTPDHQQAHVTSLPANGAESGGPETYLTVAGPAGSTLVDVATIDPQTVATPPPAGVELPSGLVSFILDGVPAGADRTVSIHVPSTAGVNGYAKYDAGSDTWSLLPAGRVQVQDGRVDITLTDGGIGDGDGVADGRIVDPGGIAEVTTAPGDTTPPVVTGEVTRAPNANGWYAASVRVRWTATDEGSGVAGPPPDTLVTGEGADLTAESALVCDLAPSPNCARGLLGGIRIDRTAPTVGVTGVADGATYVLGAVPTPGCTATDSLSGVSGTCTGVRTGGNSNGVGEVTYRATATDNAGNRRTVSVTYRVVYRFDGFLQPLNDPDLTPGSPMSVFRAGSTVPVAITLKRANGQVVTPVTAPRWVTPVRGARTSAPVNETAGSGPGSSGSAFSWRSGRWQYDWSTRGVTAGYVYRIGVRLDDGTTHYLTVGVR